MKEAISKLDNDKKESTWSFPLSFFVVSFEIHGNGFPSLCMRVGPIVGS